MAESLFMSVNPCPFGFVPRTRNVRVDTPRVTRAVNGVRLVGVLRNRVHTATLDSLAGTLDLGSLLVEITRRYGAYDLLDHRTQGEFHHDVTFGTVPDRWALWHRRCPNVANFAGQLVPILARSVTEHPGVMAESG